MAKYVAYMKQAGEGCDYTIGCGTVVKFMKSDNIQDAKKEAREILEYYGCNPGSERELSDFLIFEIKETFDFLDEFYSDIIRSKELEKMRILKDKELKELKRLQNKYQMDQVWQNRDK